MPFIPVSELIECIDDVNSRYYNQVVNRNELTEGEVPDWESSEKMSNYGVYYEQGIVVEHNTHPIKKGAGSCIFIHNWKTADDVTAGCTALLPQNLTALIHWLDSSKKPVLAQLTLEHYLELQERWALPKID
jgi:D-alanyl-D-alanine dipeptidase